MRRGRPGLASASRRTIRVCRAWRGLLRLRVPVGSAAMARTKILAGPFGLKSVFFSSRNPILLRIPKSPRNRHEDCKIFERSHEKIVEVAMRAAFVVQLRRAGE